MYSKHISLLQLIADQGTLEIYGRNEEDDQATAYELLEGGFLSCTNPHQVCGLEHDMFVNLSITVPGREKLAQWIKEEREAKFGFRLLRIMERFTLWIGVVIGAIITKAFELGLAHFLKAAETSQ